MTAHGTNKERDITKIIGQSSFRKVQWRRNLRIHAELQLTYIESIFFVQAMEQSMTPIGMNTDPSRNSKKKEGGINGVLTT
jgi:hypothetical protein